MKKIIQDYTFSASAKTITSSDFTKLSEIALITNVTDNIIIYNFADPAKGATLSGRVLTLVWDTTAMSDTDNLQIIMHAGTDIDRVGFAKAILNNVDTTMLTLKQTGSGMTVNQTGGNLVITSGTTARAETIIRGLRSYSGGIRARIQSILSQRIINQQFFYELVDVVGDSLAYTINSATSITVTLPASFGLSAQNVGQSMTLQQFSGTGTFLSGRYPIASVSGNDATFTVSAFAAGTGTLSAVGWNFYRLEYSSTTATNALYDTQRNGYASGNTTATINTTASPGHIAIITGNDGAASLQDQLIASTAVIQTANRASRAVMVPDDAQVFMQIRVLNGSTAPATTTTWTIGQVSVCHFEAESVIVQDMRPTNFQTALPVEIMRGVALATQPVSGTVTATIAAAATTIAKAEDAVHASGDVGVPAMAIRTDTPATTSSATGDYDILHTNSLGALQVAQNAHTNGGAIPYMLISAASTNATSLKASAGQIYTIAAMNLNASPRYLKLYNKASAPTVGTDTPLQVYMIPGNTAGSGLTLSVPVGMEFGTGIAFAITTGIATSDTGAVAASEIVININYL